MSVRWNPWHGCHKISEGCLHCYVYRIDRRAERDSSAVTLNSTFTLPTHYKKDGEPVIPYGETVYTCFSSDFLVEEADPWRARAWKCMAERPDLRFIFITKRIGRLPEVLPEDWGDGYENVTIGCTCENQKRADERLPVFLSVPIRHRFIVCEPMLEAVDFTPWLDPAKVEELSVGGESGPDARVCDFDWVRRVAEDARRCGVPFHYHQTGARLRKDGRLYLIPRTEQHSQARLAGLDTFPTIETPGEIE